MIDAKLSAKELIRQCESYPDDQRFLDAVVNIASLEGSPITFLWLSADGCRGITARGRLHKFESKSANSHVTHNAFSRLILASGITHDIRHFPSDFDLKSDPQWQAFSRQCRKDVAKCLADWLDDLAQKPAVDVDAVEQDQPVTPTPSFRPRHCWGDIGEKVNVMIREDRTRLNWSCEKWANAVGVPRGTFSKSQPWKDIQYQQQREKDRQRMEQIDQY